MRFSGFDWRIGTPWTPVPGDQGELQTYLPEEVQLRDGQLVITAHATGGGYTSGMVSTFGTFSQRYGRFSARVCIPKGKGLWPAFWLLPEGGFGPPEIDIAEWLGHEPLAVYCSHHWGRKKRQSYTQRITGADWTTPHTIGVRWTQRRIQWLLDGVVCDEREEHVPRVPMYLLLNLAVGGDWPGEPNEHTRFPAEFVIDWVKVEV